jgi:hypothetical protein
MERVVGIVRDSEYEGCLLKAMVVGSTQQNTAVSR